MEIIQINKDNIQQIWEEYESYLKHHSENYFSNVAPESFNSFIEDLKYCDECRQWLPSDNFNNQDDINICDECHRVNGWGE